MSAEQGASLALARIGAIVIGVELHRVTAFLESGERPADCTLAALLSLPAPDDGAARLLEVQHAGGRFVIAVPGRVRIARSESRARLQRPRLVAGVFRRACLRGVARLQSELVYLLDVEEVASRIGRKERTP